MIWFSGIGIFLQVQRQEQLRTENWNTKALFMFIQRQLSTPVQIFSGDSGWQSLSALNPRDQGWRCCRVLSDVSFAWHNRLPRAVAVCCPLFAVRVVRSPLSVVGCRINTSNTRASICFRKFPKIISYLIFASCTMFAQLKILCCSGTHLIPLYVVRHTVNVYTTIYLIPAGLTSVQYTQFYICFMTLRLIMLVVDVDVVLWPLPPMNYGPS